MNLLGALLIGFLSGFAFGGWVVAMIRDWRQERRRS
jgi:hypothetical protein